MWLEIIHVRTSEKTVAQVLRAIEPVWEKTRHEAGLSETRVYVHGRIEGDLAVHLRWETDQAGPTPLGHAIARSLRGFGMVDHSTWKQV